MKQKSSSKVNKYLALRLFIPLTFSKYITRFSLNTTKRGEVLKNVHL